MYLSEFREHLIGSDVLLASIKLDSPIVALTVGVERVTPNTNILTLVYVSTVKKDTNPRARLLPLKPWKCLNQRLKLPHKSKNLWEQVWRSKCLINRTVLELPSAVFLAPSEYKHSQATVCVETKFVENKWLNDVITKFASELASIFSDMVQTGLWWKNIKKYIRKHLRRPR